MFSHFDGGGLSPSHAKTIMTTGSVGQGSHFIIKNCINSYVSRGGIGMGFLGIPNPGHFSFRAR